MQKNIIELLDPSDLKSNPPDYQLNPDNELVIRERKLVTKNGQVVELEISRKKIADNRILGMARNVTEYKKVQKQIALSESTLRAAFEYSAIGMVMVSMEGKYLRTNIEFSQMTGYSREELMHMNFTDTTYKDDIEGDIVFIDHVIRGEMDSIKREKRYVCKDGNIIWVKLNASIVRDADGTPLFVISQSENITEQKKADLEIQKLNRLYQFISEANEYLLRAENIDDLFKESCRIAVELGGVRMAWVGIIDKDKMVQPLTWFGHEDGYLKKITISSDINHPGGKGPSGQAIRSRKYYFSNDIDNDPAMEIWRIDALQRNYHSSICYPVVIKEEVKAVFTMYVSETNYFNDTEIKLLQELVDNMAFALEKIQVKAMHQKAENNLAESEEKFRTLVEQSMVGVYILQDNKFVYVNPGFEKIAGYSKEELIGHMSFEDMIHEDDIQTIKENYGSVANGEKIRVQYILRTIHGSGQLKHIEIILSTILYKDRPAIIGSAIDITDRIEEGKRIEQAIIDAQEKERLQIGMELHDNVKQIIGASILQLDVLKRKLGDATTAFGIIDNLIAYNNEAVNELRRLSHQLAPSVDSTISLKEKITILASNMNIGNKLIIDIDVDEMPAMLSNKLQLTFYRVIQERLNNIVKYAKAAHVKITIKIDGHNIALAVADDGQGFDINQKKGLA
jgi:PAS domain S-box-containing protein